MVANVQLTSEQLDELRAIDSPTIANAIEYFSIRPRVAGYCGSNVRCMTPDAGFMLGYAVTCKGDSTTEDKDRREHAELYKAIYAMQDELGIPQSGGLKETLDNLSGSQP